MAEDYIIQAKIVVDERDADLAVRGVDGSMARMQGRAASLGGTISKMTGMFAMLGGVYGMGRAVKGVLGLQVELQNAEGSLATLFNSLGGMEISDALGLARTEIQGLRQDAAKGVGELSDYTEAYQRLAAPLMSAGLGTDAIRAFTRQSLTAGFASRGQEGLKLAPMDIVQALTGGAGDRTTPVVIQALSAIGMGADEFNKLDVRAKTDVLMRAFGTFEEGAKLMGQSWDAQMATLGDGVKELIRTATRPLFDRWSQQLQKANAWMEKNSDRLNEMAEKWGPKLVEMWDTLISRAGTYAAIVAGAAVAQSLPTGVGGSRGGGLAGLSGGGGMLSQLTGLLGTIIRFAGPAAIVSVAFVAMQGALQEFPSLLTMIGEQVGFVVSGFWLVFESFGGLTQSGSALNLVGFALIQQFRGLGTVLGFVLRGVGLVVEVFGLFLTSLGVLVQRLVLTARMAWALASGDLVGGKQAADQFRALNQSGAESLGANVGRIKKILGLQEDLDAKAKEPGSGGLDANGLKGSNGGNTYISKVEMQVKTEMNADPARVMIALDEGLDKVRRHARQPRRVPLAAGV